jgi:hypothetical protein
VFEKPPNLVVVDPGGVQGGFVDDVGQVGAGKSGRQRRQPFRVLARALVELDAFHVLQSMQKKFRAQWYWEEKTFTKKDFHTNKKIRK